MTLLPIVLVGFIVIAGLSALLAGLFENYGLLQLSGLAFAGLLVVAVVVFGGDIISWFSEEMPDLTPIGPSDGGQ